MTKYYDSYLDRLRESANDSARNFRVVYTFYLVIALYILVIVSSTDHETLFMASKVQMPIINAGVPVAWFFTVVPWILTILHLNLLVQAIFLSRKIFQYSSLLDKKYTSSRESLAALSLLFPIPLAHKLAYADHRTSMQFLLSVMVSISMILLPPSLLIYTQIQFLPYQHEALCWLHRVAITTNVGILWWLWPRIAAPSKSWLQWWKTMAIENQVDQPKWKSYIQRWIRTDSPGIILSVLLSVTAGGFVFVIADVQGGSVSEALPIFDPLRDGLGRTYDLNGRVLVLREPSPELLAVHYEAACDSKNIADESTNSEDSERCDESIIAIGSPFWCKFATPINGKGRKFRKARLARATLCKAIFEEADLKGSLLYRSNLHGANFYEADLRDSFLEAAGLQDALLWRADLRKANASDADFRGSNSREADLREANLRDASFQRAFAFRSDFSGANLSFANLDSANLDQANSLELS